MDYGLIQELLTRATKTIIINLTRNNEPSALLAFVQASDRPCFLRVLCAFVLLSYFWFVYIFQFHSPIRLELDAESCCEVPFMVLNYVKLFSLETTGPISITFLLMELVGWLYSL